jgi:SAM-dependent methyltransferase
MLEQRGYKDIFNERAESYHRAMQTWPRARDEEFAAIVSLAGIEPQHSILDMHSGGGYLSWYLPEEQELYHLETSSVFAGCGRSGTHHPVLLIDGGQLPFADNSIDRFLSLAGLHHLDDKKPVFREMSRVLKPGGTGVIADAHAGSSTAQFLDQCVHRHNPMGHTGSYLCGDTAGEISSCGLTVTSGETRHYHWNYANEEEMTDYCRQMFGMTRGSRQDIRRGIERHLGCRRDSGAVKMNWNLHFIRAEKPLVSPARSDDGP